MQRAVRSTAGDAARGDLRRGGLRRGGLRGGGLRGGGLGGRFALAAAGAASLPRAAAPHEGGATGTCKHHIRAHALAAAVAPRQPAWKP